MCISPRDCSSIQTIFAEMIVTFFVMSFRRLPDIRVSLTSLQCSRVPFLALVTEINIIKCVSLHFWSRTILRERRSEKAAIWCEVSAPRTAHWRLRSGWGCCVLVLPRFFQSTLKLGFFRVPDLPSGYSKHISITTQKVSLQITVVTKTK